MSAQTAVVPESPVGRVRSEARPATPSQQSIKQVAKAVSATQGSSPPPTTTKGLYTFHPEDFLSESFTVDRFVAEQRKRVPLPQLKDDLTQYFETLNVSMVELINKDYADFVSLSSNLVGLDRALSSLNEPLHRVKQDVQAVKQELDAEIESLQAKLQDRERTRDSTLLLQRLLNISSSIDKIEHLLGISEGAQSTVSLNAQSDDGVGKLIERVASEFNQLQFYVSQCKTLPFVQNIKPRIVAITDTLEGGLQQTFRQGIDNQDVETLRQCLRTYAIIDKVNDAEGLFRQLVVSPYTTEWVTRDKWSSDGLPALYQRLLDFVSGKCQVVLDATSVADGGVPGFDFLVNAVWAEYVESITSRLPQVFSPAVADEFHKNYLETQDFISRFEALCRTQTSVKRLRVHPAFVSFRKRWTLPVYFQLRFQQIAGAFESELSEGFSNYDPARPYCIPQMQTLCSSIVTCWEPEVFLPALTHRFWRLSMQLVSRFCTWVSSSPNLDPQPPREHILRVLQDVESKLAPEVSRIFLSTVLPRVKECSKGSPGLKDAFADTELALKTCVETARDNIVEQLSQECGKRLDGAKQVKSQYHYRNREPPTAASSYVSLIFEPLAAFLSSHSGAVASAKWSEKIVLATCGKLYDIIEEVLSSVKKQEEDLRRLKNRRQTGLTDYDKMRLQFVLDVKALQEEITKLEIEPVNIHSFVRLKERVGDETVPVPTTTPGQSESEVRGAIQDI